MLQDLPPANVPATTYLQYASQEPQGVYDLDVSDYMTMIPGMSYANPPSGWSSASTYSSDFFGASAPVQQCAQPVPTPSAPAPQPQLQPQTIYIPAAQVQLVAPPTQMPQDLAIRTVTHASAPAHTGFQHQLGGPFRPSVWELEPDFYQATSQMPFQTSIFRKCV